MQLPPLTPGRILRRYKRFLADVELADGRRVTAHCPNTGSMQSCWEPGAPVQLSYSDNRRRKLAWTLERVDMGRGWIGVHTGRVNAVVAEAIAAGGVPELAGYGMLQREVSFSPSGAVASRLDLALRDGPAADVLVEVKNVTLWQGGCVEFPDAVTQRGRRHLEALAAAVRLGFRGVMIYAVNRPEGDCFAPAAEIDPEYADTLGRVACDGVELLALRIAHGVGDMRVTEKVPVSLGHRPGSDLAGQDQ